MITHGRLLPIDAKIVGVAGKIQLAKIGLCKVLDVVKDSKKTGIELTDSEKQEAINILIAVAQALFEAEANADELRNWVSDFDKELNHKEPEQNAGLAH